MKLHQVSAAELLAVSQRDNKRQIGSFTDRQGDNPASVCVNKNATISPCLTTGLTPLSISRAPIIAHRGPPVSPVYSSREEKSHPVLKACANQSETMWQNRLPQFYYFPQLQKKIQTRFLMFQ